MTMAAAHPAQGAPSSQTVRSENFAIVLFAFGPDAKIDTPRASERDGKILDERAKRSLAKTSSTELSQKIRTRQGSSSSPSA